jgi:hypothetical protein
LTGGCSLEVPCRTDLAAATPMAAHLGRALRESDVRSGETVTVTTWGPTLAAARTPILPNLLQESGKGSFSSDCCSGQGAPGHSSYATSKVHKANQLVVYVDAGYAQEHERHSQTGFALMLNGACHCVCLAGSLSWLTLLDMLRPLCCMKHLTGS